MGNSSKRGAITYETEASWGVDTTTFATWRLSMQGKVDVSELKQEKIDSDRVTQRRQDGTQWHLGTFKNATFKTRFELPGLGSSTSGAYSASQLVTLLQYVFGNLTASSASGTTFTGGTATAPTTTASGTFAAGSLGRAGVLGDARGNGQWFAVSTHSGNTLNLLTGIPAAPSNGDVTYGAFNLYPSEAPTSTSIQSLRFLLQTANLMYECHGCVAIAVQIGGFQVGKVPFIEITWAVSWYRYSTSTFPTTVATETHQAKATAAGSLFMADVGTATRATLSYLDFTIDYTLGVELFRGPGGVNAFQEIIGAVRTIDEIKIGAVVNAPAASTNPSIPALATGTTAQHMLLTHNPTANQSVAIYVPNLCLDDVPSQFDDNGINRLRLTGHAYTGPTTTTDLTASAIRFGFA